MNNVSLIIEMSRLSRRSTEVQPVTYRRAPRGHVWVSTSGLTRTSYAMGGVGGVRVGGGVYVYQCRGRACLFGAGHCVGFVVHLWEGGGGGGSVEGT